MIIPDFPALPVVLDDPNAISGWMRHATEVIDVAARKRYPPNKVLTPDQRSAHGEFGMTQVWELDSIAFKATLIDAVGGVDPGPVARHREAVQQLQDARSARLTADSREAKRQERAAVAQVEATTAAAADWWEATSVRVGDQLAAWLTRLQPSEQDSPAASQKWIPAWT